MKKENIIRETPESLSSLIAIIATATWNTKIKNGPFEPIHL